MAKSSSRSYGLGRRFVWQLEKCHTSSVCAYLTNRAPLPAAAERAIMSAIAIRPAHDPDIPAMVDLRAREWETAAYWQTRITGYLRGELSPQKALPPRAAFVAEEPDLRIVGFVAGHLTRRFTCDAEIEWLNVAESHRGQGLAGQLIAAMAAWFISQNAVRVCVDPGTAPARRLYTRLGAQPLNPHWLNWPDIRQSFPTSK
jgi:GNAT superfamily N-acetyltransferase